MLIAILGRQPALGLAELESLYGHAAIQPLGTAALLDVDPTKNSLSRHGGTVKMAKLLTTLNTTDWAQILKYLTDALPQHLQYIPEGKIRFGLSVYGLPTKPATLNRSGLEIKKVIKRNSRSVRVVPNTSQELNSAQILHNQLTGPTGMELLLVRQGQKTHLAQTVWVQDITAYAARDQARPKRDARIGMLPPKLAQIIVNLAGKHTLPSTGSLPSEEDSKSHHRTVHPGPSVLLDPFCGTGVILQEGLLMGYDAYGTDLEPRMADYTNQNLDWLKEKLKITGSYKAGVGDATSLTWETPIDLIASETYLGRAFSSTPTPEVLSQVMQDVDTIHKKFLQNVSRQTETGFRLCIAVPAWKVTTGFKHLKVLDHLEELGYTRQSFVHATNDQLVYHRPNQIVARELVVLKRA